MTREIPALYSREQVAVKWGISKWWLRDMVAARKVPFHTVAGRTRFTDEDINWILENTRDQKRGELAQTPPAPAPPPVLRRGRLRR